MKNFINGWTADKVIAHIEENFKGKAYNRQSNRCFYKKGNKKCAIGLFLPEGHPGQKSTRVVYELLLQYPELKKYIPVSDSYGFQRIHDCADQDNARFDFRTDEEVLMDLVSYIESIRE